MSELTPNSAESTNRIERGAIYGIKSSDLSAAVQVHEFTSVPSGATDDTNVTLCSPSNVGDITCSPWTGKRVVHYDSCADQMCPRTPAEIAANTDAYVVTLWDDLQKCETKYQFINCGEKPQTGQPITEWDSGQTSGMMTPGADADQTI